MEQKTRNQLITVLTLVILALTVAGYSQSVNDAIAKYNEGAQLLKTDIQGSLNAFNECIKICNSLGEEGEETKMLAEIQIPGLHYQLAMNSYKEKKYDEAIKKLQETVDIAGKYNDEQIKGKAEKIIPQLYYINANALIKSEEFQTAIENFDKAIEYNPLNPKAYLGKGLAYKQLDDLQKMKEAMDKAIETGLSTNDDKTVENAEKVARNTFYNKGVMAFEAKNYDEAEGYLKTSIEYGNQSVDTHFQLGKIYNTQKNWDKAIEQINRAIELEQGDETAKAKLYYELAASYVGSGNTSAACDAYKKASYGPYAENAKYQIEHVLKCK
jgi:tetratricopeptide (TPR) repeat protein